VPSFLPTFILVQSLPTCENLDTICCKLNDYFEKKIGQNWPKFKKIKIKINGFLSMLQVGSQKYIRISLAKFGLWMIVTLATS
jgi:hypothetical protein